MSGPGRVETRGAQTIVEIPGRSPTRSGAMDTEASDNMWGDELGRANFHVIWGNAEKVSGRSEERSSGEKSSGATLSDSWEVPPQVPPNVELRSESASTSRSRQSGSSSPSSERIEQPRKTKPSPLGIMDSIANRGTQSTHTANASDSCGDQEELDEDKGEGPEPDPNGKLPSLGSSRHFDETCKPCLFVHTRIGCKKGEVCLWCHFSHFGQRRPRPCKSKRDRYRKLIEQTEEEMFGRKVDI